ncbi:sugar phosphate isomerase/epimerase family protein [Occallatibacter riparius]|uniref:Sugar phosphate isomerase/epimerase n=1 Tax=Occallatibacter riparius TaxID=1002689 RepID=A0A9J7BQN7_9BACT|nr:sugar phosphate isomerase/epimerase [Occallatibacter riparius]UWZ84881.1 sugar phosphate isomerase/epimerase [Occallatibacter riparius]
MPSISRRTFLQTAAASAAILPFARSANADPLGLPIGCQTWPVRQLIAKDFPGTLKQLSAAGFKSIELCSPVGYATMGFGGLQKYSGADLRKVINDAGLTTVSSHFSLDELRKDQPARIAWAKEVGLTQMLVASLGGPKNPTADDVKRAADEYNKIGERAHAAGITQGLHNEDFECSTVDGKRVYDMLFELLDPSYVKFQFQVSNIQYGFDAADYFTRYPGRFISMHAQGWSATQKKIVPIGQDSLDWKRIFTAAKTAGIQNYFVEMDLPLMQASVPYLKQLQV